MYMNFQNPSGLNLATEKEVLDDVVSSFGESLDSVLKTNFKPNPKSEIKTDSNVDQLNSDTSTTKNQRLAAIFCRQWLLGVFNTLVPKLADESKDNDKNVSLSVPSEPEFVEEQLEFQDIDDLGVCVENARVSENNSIVVDYEALNLDINKQFKPKLRAQQLMDLILKGKDEEWSLHKKLDNFWKSSPGLLLQLISNNVPLEDDELPSDSMNAVMETASVDEEAMEFLNRLLDSDQNNMNNLEEYLTNNPRMLLEQANKLGIVGVDRLVELFNKLKKEVAHVNKMARFFSKFAVELNSNQVEIM